MIEKETVLSVADNSGAKKVLCISISGSKTCARVGDVITVSVKRALPGSKINPGSVHRAVVIRVKKKFAHSVICSEDNAVVLLNKQDEMIGTRVFGPTDRLLRSFKGSSRILSLCKESCQ